MTAGSVLGIVTLFLNSTLLNDFDHYEPKKASPAWYYYVNSTFEKEPMAVAFDQKYFGKSVLFPKCCPPGFLYEAENRNCEAKNISEIYEDLNISVNLVKYGLANTACFALIDRLINATDLRRFDGNGTLSIDGATFDDESFCIDKTTNSSDIYVIRLCRGEDYCFDGNTNNSKDWCIHKCCEDTYSLIDTKCRQTTKMGLSVKKYKNLYERTDGYGFLVHKELLCGATEWFNLRQLDVTISTNGSLFWNDESIEYKINEYCLDTSYNTRTETYTDIIAVCILDNLLYVKWRSLRIAIIFTCVCFGITIAVHIFVYRMKKLSEKIITCFCTIDLIFYALYALRIYYTDFGTFCTAFGYIYFFMMISRLSWLNVLSYEIWQNVGRTRTKAVETAADIRKRFAYLCAYAITVPFFWLCLLILSDQKLLHLPESITAHINPSACAVDTTLYGSYGHYLNLYLPISILIIINLVFYIKTVVHFLKVKRDINRRATPNISRKDVKQNNKNGVIIMKLGLVMGITWIYYMFDYLTNFEHIYFLEVVGDILRFLNVLEGFYFLIIFAVKWKTIKEIFYKLKITKKKEHTESTSSMSTDIHTIGSNESISTTNAIPMETLST